MPGISDPGYRVVCRAVQRGVPVVPVPGPVAVEAALAASGLPSEAFRFCGFPPPRQVPRRRLLQSLATETATLIFYEAPHRILATLEEVVEVLGPRPVVVARELTKIHEEFLRGTADAVLAELRRRPAVKGEITLLIGRGERPVTPQVPLPRRVEQLMREQRLDRMAALKQAARERGISKREAYRQWESRPAGEHEGEED